MSNRSQTIVCRNCGRGFTLTRNYCNWLSQRGAKVLRPLLCPTCFMKVGPLPKRQGRIKWFSRRKHYGFIVPEEGDSEIFFHQQQIFDDDAAQAREGQVVHFHLGHSPKGPEALNVEFGEGS
jgi:cold shock protein